MFERIQRVFKLDAQVFEEVEHDESATSQAAIIVAIVAVLSAIGAFVGATMANSAISELGGLEEQLGEFASVFDAVGQLSPTGAALNAFVAAFVGWALWSALTYFIGVNVFKGEATFNEMLRVIGFAQAPRLLGVFSFIPCLGGLLLFAGGIWSLVAGFVGIRQGLDLDNTKTALTVILSWLAAFLVNALLLGPLWRLIGFG